MKRPYFLLLVMAVIYALIGTHAYAVQRDLTNNEGVMGCNTYYQGRGQYRGWLVGFLNAQQSMRNLDVLRYTSQPRVFSIFDRFCYLNPNRTLYEAADYTLNALRARR